MKAALGLACAISITACGAAAAIFLMPMVHAWLTAASISSVVLARTWNTFGTYGSRSDLAPLVLPIWAMPAACTMGTIFSMLAVPRKPTSATAFWVSISALVFSAVLSGLKPSSMLTSLIFS